MTKQRGFTLIELLIVMAIIAILATILFPVFARARESGRRAACGSNLRQLGLGLAQYTEDYDGRYPDRQVYDAAGNRYYAWSTGIQPYVKSSQILQCPSEIMAPVPLNSQNYSLTFSDYYYNRNFCVTYPTTTPLLGGIHSSVLHSPSLTVLLGEGYASEVGQSYDSHPTSIFSSQQCGNEACTTYVYKLSRIIPTRRHLDGANYLLADGHVKWFRQEMVAEGTSSSNSGGTVAAFTDALGTYAATFNIY